MELEAAADPAERGSYPFAVIEREQLCLDPRETVRAISDDLAGGASPALVSARFHNALAGATARALAVLAEHDGVGTVVLSGGVFQNRLMAERCSEQLSERGLAVLLPRALPPNDGAISYGQAAAASARRRASASTRRASGSS